VAVSYRQLSFLYSVVLLVLFSNTTAASLGIRLSYIDAARTTHHRKYMLSTVVWRHRLRENVPSTRGPQKTLLFYCREWVFIGPLQSSESIRHNILYNSRASVCPSPAESGQVLIKIKNKQNFWVFGLFSSSGILENRKHDVSETGSVSVPRWSGKTPTQLGLLERVNLNWVGVFSPHLRTETDPVSETSHFSIF
jgi:hypothetical protein